MLEWIITQFKTNPMFVGGVSSVLLGGILFMIKGVPQAIWRFVKIATTTEFTIYSQSGGYLNVDKYIQKLKLDIFSRMYRVSNGQTLSGYGSSIGWYKGFIMFTNKMSIQNQYTWEVHDALRVTFLGKRKTLIESFLNDSNLECDSKNTITISFPDEQNIGVTTKQKRHISTVFIDNNIKTNIQNKVRWFVENEKWYKDRGIPYKLVILLHGEPGTGKTSLIHAICSQYDFPVRYITSVYGMTKTFSNCQRLALDNGYQESTKTNRRDCNQFFILEDIDTLLTSKRTQENPTPTAKDETTDNTTSILKDLGIMSLHGVLNTLDGITSIHGMIVFITTNNISKLDYALQRKGRIDVCQEISRLNVATMIQMFTNFYGNVGNNTEIWKDVEKRYTPMTGAILQDILMNNGPDDALKLILRSNNEKTMYNPDN